MLTGESHQPTAIDETSASSSRPKRSIVPTARVLDPSNVSAPILTSHKDAAAEARRAAAAAATAKAALERSPVASENSDPLSPKRTADQAALDSGSGNRHNGMSPIITEVLILMSHLEPPEVLDLSSDSEDDTDRRPKKKKGRVLVTSSVIILRAIFSVEASQNSNYY